MKPESVNSQFFFTNEEIVCSTEFGVGITSGGRFSNQYARPAYQQSAVKAYLASRDIPSLQV
jgi:hypothetical protein